MGKLKIPRGLYLSHRQRADHQTIFRFGHAPRLRERGVKAFDFYADGRALTRADLARYGIDTDPPRDRSGAPILHAGTNTPLPLPSAIEAAGQLVEAMKAAEATSAPAPARQKKRPARGKRRSFTVGDLLEGFFSPQNHKLNRREAATIASYKSWRAPVDEVFSDEPLTNMTEDMIEEWFWLMVNARGHRMAYGAYQLLRRAWNWGRRHYKERVWFPDIIWTEIETPKPKPKLRPEVGDELVWLMRAMDDPASLCDQLQLPADDDLRRIPARPELGDGFMLAIWTVQRVSDVLRMDEHMLRTGRLKIRTGKKGTKRDLPILAPLEERLTQARERRTENGRTHTYLVAHPDKDAKYTYKTFSTHFRQARALAARFAPSLLGGAIDDYGDEIPAFTFEDCRDVGITRLLDAGCTLEQVASWSNHKDANALREVLPSYGRLGADVADAAGDKLMSHVNKKGIAV